MTLEDLWLSDAKDAFGGRFRDWHVVGWEEGRVHPNYFCELPLKSQPAPVAAVGPKPKQMELFA